MKAMCKFFGVSSERRIACMGEKLGETDPDQGRMEKIQAVYEASHKSYGYRRITIHLQRKLGLQINHKAVLRLMGKQIFVRKPESSKCTKSWKKSAPTMSFNTNVLNETPYVCDKAFNPEVWVTDVTYIRTLQGWAYLSTIKDLYDGFIVAHVFDLTNSIALVTQTLKRAKQKEKVTDGLVLHSDQGDAIHCTGISCPCRRGITSRLPCRVVETAGIMLRWRTSLDISKEEYLRQFKQPPLKTYLLEQLIDEYIYFYNYEFGYN